MNVATSIDATEPSPFHAGEQAFQTLTGKREAMESFGKRAIRSYMPDQHRDFFKQLPFMVIGSVNEKGWPWASILPGKAGSVASPDPKTLTLSAPTLAGDPLKGALRPGAPLGLLGIDIDTRRRNRLNAHVRSVVDGEVVLSVDQSFGNCPQYIQRRSVDFINEPGAMPSEPVIQTMHALDDSAAEMIRSADTFFVASYINSVDRPDIEGVDVSHRGGKPGFVKVEGDTLTVPDFPGNYHFNTLGNFLINPKAGLVFLDFVSGDVLQLTGTVELIDAEDPSIMAFGGAERGWRFKLDHGLRLTAALPFRSVLKEISPNSLLAGDWLRAEATLDAEAQRNTWRPHSVVRVVDESSEIRSFYLEPTDGSALPSYKAGQFLTIRIKSDSNDPALNRTYTLSSAPGEATYRISVKREAQGTVSRYLHDQLTVGDSIDAKAPLGGFFIDPTESRPAVLIAGGVGITPMISMAEHVAIEGLRTRYRRELTVIHAAQTTNQRAFAQRLSDLQTNSNGSLAYYSVISNPDTHQQAGVEFYATGRINGDMLKQLLALDDYDFYVCGPSGFMQAIYDDLRALGVNDARIFAEAFGPASMLRKPDEGYTEPSTVEEAEQALIKFSASGFEQRWNAGDQTLLEVAEAHGLTPEYGCRSGSCGSCATKLLSGSVSYRTAPTAPHEDNEVLICCAVPSKHSDTLELDL